MQVDFIISRTEFAIVEISGKGKDESFAGPNSASTVKSLQNLLFPYRQCDGSYAAATDSVPGLRKKNHGKLLHS